MKKMKVQKGWKYNAHTIPHYEYIDKLNIMWITKDNVFSLHKNIPLIRQGMFWNYEFKHRGFVVDANTVYWFNDEPIILLKNLEVR